MADESLPSLWATALAWTAKSCCHEANSVLSFSFGIVFLALLVKLGSVVTTGGLSQIGDTYCASQ